MQKFIVLLSFFAIVIASVIYSGCRRDIPSFDLGATKYPEKIADIIMTKCAVSGCHNSQSKDAAAGLDLTSWEKMFEGDRNGAVCIPYSADYSTLFMFTNTFSDMGAMVEPTMPNNGPPLTREQETTLRDWINAGAPDANGFVKWSDNPNRKKYYVTCQGCDVVVSIDAATNLQMRYIPVGADVAVESPHNLKISPDGQYWACSFSNYGRYLEIHRTSDDAFVSRILLGPDESSAVGSWNTFAYSNDSHYAWAIDWSTNGRQAWVDLQTFHWRQTYQGSGWTIQPHGSFVDPAGQFLYIAPTTGNYVYKLDISLPQLPNNDQIVTDGSGFQNPGILDGNHDIIFSPDGTKYFVTAANANVVRVMDVATDALIATVPVGIYPQEMAISSDPSTPYLYVTCMEDTATYPGNRGSIAVINWQTNSFVTSINSGFQPHGITVNDDLHVVLVANRNFSPGGPAPHHATSCAGRNGYFTLINMNTNTFIPGSKTELAVDPYSAAYRR